MFEKFGQSFHVSERALQQYKKLNKLALVMVDTDLENHIVDGHWRCKFRFERQLKTQLSFAALRWITLIVIDASFDDPLQIEGRKASSFIEKFMNVFVCYK